MNKIGQIILLFVLGTTCLLADVNHVVIFFDGHSEVGLIDSMDLKSIYLTRNTTQEHVALPLNDVYLAYNDYDRLFYVSTSFMSRMDQIEQYSGTIITIDGGKYPFKKFYYNRNFISPEIYVTTSEDSLFSMSLFNIHHIELDYSTLSLSVAKGFHRSAGLFLGYTTLEILGGWRRSLKHTQLISMASANSLGSNMWSSGQKLLPRAELVALHRTGVRYESMILSFSLFTAGQMAWDIWRGNRNHYFFPHDRLERYPRSMFVFSIRQWLSDEAESIRRQIGY
ncbi:MAG: hypothetical protein GXO90_03205 [FCB group bacterium]|nr:hypothetical protein [FCB group bacterium]